MKLTSKYHIAEKKWGFLQLNEINDEFKIRIVLVSYFKARKKTLCYLSVCSV